MQSHAGVRSPSFSEYEKGILLVLISTLAWSASGVYSRLLTTDPLTAIPLRSVFGGLALLVPSYFLEGGWSKRQWLSALRPAGLAIIVLNVISQASFVGALYTTSVANVAVISATAPFIAASLAWVLLGQRVEPRTMIAGGLCLVGVVIVVGESSSGGNSLGNLLALVMTVTFAMIIVLPRMSPGVAILPPTVISAFVSGIVFIPFASLGTLDLYNCVVLAAFGATNFSFAFVVFMAGARRVRPAEAALIMTLETILTPAWVWIAFGEKPPTSTFVGGAVIFCAVVGHTLIDVLRTRRAR